MFLRLFLVLPIVFFHSLVHSSVDETVDFNFPTAPIPIDGLSTVKFSILESQEDPPVDILSNDYFDAHLSNDSVSDDSFAISELRELKSATKETPTTWDWKCLSDPWKCVLKVFFNDSNSIAAWFMNAIGQSKKVSTLMLEVVKTCGAKVVRNTVPDSLWNLVLGGFKPLGPYDAVICDVFHAIRTGTSEEIQLLGMTNCTDSDGKPIQNHCLKQFIGKGSKLEMLKTIVSAITGWKMGESEEGIAKEIATYYESCYSHKRDVTTCLSFSFVQAACSGICRSAKCQVDVYRNSTSTECQKAVQSGCSALFEASATLCNATLSSVNPEAADAFPHQKCDAECPASSAKGLSIVLSIFSLVFIQSQLSF